MSRLFIALSFFVLFSIPLSSRHLIGGHFEYVCLTSNESGSYLRLKMVLIRDVSGGGADFDVDSWVGVYEKNNDGSYTYFTTIANIAPLFVEDLNLSSYLPFSHFRTEVFQKGVYEMEVRLPKGKDYTLAYQRCCYTDDVTNILDSGENGLALTMDISSEALDNCDNSPVLPSLPFLLAPIGIEINYPINAYDPDGNDIEMELGRFSVSGGTDGVTSGNPQSCTGVRPSSQSCPPPYNTALFILPDYSDEDPFGPNDLDFNITSNAFVGMATVSGRFAYTVECLQFDNGELLSAQNIQYISTFVADLGTGRMIAHPFIDLNSNGIRESEEPPFLGIQLDVEEAFLNQVQDDGSVIVKVEPGNYEVEPHLPKGWAIQNNQTISVSIDQSQKDYDFDIPIVKASNEQRYTAHAAFSQGECNEAGLLLLTVRNEGSENRDIQIQFDNPGMFTIDNHPDNLYTIDGNTLIADVSGINLSSWTTIPVYVNNTSSDTELMTDLIVTTESTSDTLQVLLSPVCGSKSSTQVSPTIQVENMDKRIIGHLAFRNDNPGNVFLVRSKIRFNEHVDINSFRIESSSEPVNYILNKDDRTIEVIMNTSGIPPAASGNRNSGGIISYSVLPDQGVENGDVLVMEAEIFMDNHMPISPDPLSISVDLQHVSTSDLSFKIDVYPNPFTSEIWLKGIQESGQMTIYDIHGKVVRKESILKNQRMVLDQITPGIYFYQFRTDSGQASGRLIKQ